MVNSKKQMVYTTTTISSSFILMVLVLVLFPSFNSVNAQEEENVEEEKSNPLTILSNIRNLLDKSIAELNAGNYESASELVDIAYIDNYEYIEDPLKELDQDLMEETELMIREDLASAIEDKKPLDEITTLHNNIRSNLDMAEKLFKQQ
ncbi:MAG TPA: hypothetical protein VFT83_00165 [Nitrososphaeraceae archaeon]|jgi:hypothetical protein|nr:hypothetical protein [Nitrososphaeraceae archaeon]HEU5171917.1 hypothetical protein [Nitrososphaeraceae archaeon]